MRGAAAIIARLREEGRAPPELEDREAATLLWELTSFRVWDDLVNESGLAPDRHAETVNVTATATPPLARSASQPARRTEATPYRHAGGD